MKLGLISEYRVERETDLGYMISDETGEYFLHHNECNGNYYKDGEIIEAFLYVDKMKRIAATAHIPFITVDTIGICEVVGNSSAGVFVNIGISRDILLSSDDLPDKKWPEIGDKLCCTLRTRGKSLFIKLLAKPEILEHTSGELELNQKYEAHVYRVTDKGINVITNNFNVVFIYYKHLRKDYRLGERVEVKIIDYKDNDYYGTLISQKETMMQDDALVILDYLKSHHGVMNFTSNTDPEILYNVFKMSKSAFKRALGKLFKEHKVILEDDKTIMVDYLKNKTEEKSK